MILNRHFDQAFNQESLQEAQKEMEKTYKCSYCKDTIIQAFKIEHENSCEAKIRQALIPCEICDQRIYFSEMESHILAHQLNESENLPDPTYGYSAYKPAFIDQQAEQERARLIQEIEKRKKEDRERLRMAEEKENERIAIRLRNEEAERLTQQLLSREQRNETRPDDDFVSLSEQMRERENAHRRNMEDLLNPAVNYFRRLIS